MPDNYELALFIHVVGVFAIGLTAGANIFTLAWMRRAHTVQELRHWTPLAVWTDRAFPVAAIIVLLAGAWLVEEVSFSWGDGWINVSLLWLIVMGAGGGLLITPRIARIHKAAHAAPDGPVGDELRTALNDPILWGALHGFALVLVAIIWNMTVKPSDAQAGAVSVVAFLLGAASALPMTARARRAGNGR